MSKSELLPTLAAFTWAGRNVPIIFDSDIAEKPHIQASEERLSVELSGRGAIVRKVRLPQGESNRKVGADDYLITHTTDELINLVWNATPAAGSYDPPIALSVLMAKSYPPTEYVWADFILKGEINSLYGDGGVGKSLLALHLAVAVGAGKPLFGNATIQMPVLGLFAEDGEAQTQHRVSTILINLGLDASGDLPVRLWCQPREDTLLAAIDDNGVVKELPRLQTLRAELARIGRPVLLVLDSLADLFALNESLRLPVNSALKRVLGGLCRDFGATVLILAHPSKASIQDGTDYSGSTAFNNAVRQRLTLEIVKRQSGDMVEGPPPRVLRVAKSNYGPPAEKTLWFYGATIDELQRGPAISPDEERRIVLTTMLRLIDTGVRIMKSNGDGQKPKDVAQEIRDKHNLAIPVRRVREHLDALERDGYSPISKRTRTTRQ